MLFNDKHLLHKKLLGLHSGFDSFLVDNVVVIVLQPEASGIGKKVVAAAARPGFTPLIIAFVVRLQLKTVFASEVPIYQLHSGIASEGCWDILRCAAETRSMLAAQPKGRETVWAN